MNTSTAVWKRGIAQIRGVLLRDGTSTMKMVRRLGRRLTDALIVPVAIRAVAQTGLSRDARLRNLQSSLRKEIADLRDRIAKETPDNPCIHGFKVYAQTDEDGIIEYILGRLPSHSKTFIEIGCGRGTENNTHYLSLKNYRGCWADGDGDNISLIAGALGGLEFEALLIEKHFVSVENVGEIITHFCDFIGTREPGFFHWI
jgi:hypothetical protein